MSKFKVGDKVIYNGVHDEIDEIVYVGGKFFGYDLIINNIWPVKEKYLQPYKTPHERLIELGWKITHEDENMIIYNKSFSKSLSFHKKHANCFTNERNIDLQFAEILVDYLKELSNE